MALWELFPLLASGAAEGDAVQRIIFVFCQPLCCDASKTFLPLLLDRHAVPPPGGTAATLPENYHRLLSHSWPPGGRRLSRQICSQVRVHIVTYFKGLVCEI